MKGWLALSICAVSLSTAVYSVGMRFAREADDFNGALNEMAKNVSQQHAIPDDYQPPKPGGLLGMIYEKHPNNELVKGIYFAIDPDGFALNHPNNEAAKLYSVLSAPKQFIKMHPNNDLAKGLQIFVDTKGFYTDHPNNDFAKALEALYDPNGFRKTHPNNEIAKAYQLVFAPGGFMHDHPNNEITRFRNFIARGFR